MKHPFVLWLINLRGWKWWVTGLLLALVLLFSTPYFTWLPNVFKGEDWQTVMKQVNSPTFYQPDGTGDLIFKHSSKKTFRLTVPLTARLLHLNAYGIYALQFLLGIVFIYLMLRHCHREFSDRLTA